MSVSSYFKRPFMTFFFFIIMCLIIKHNMIKWIHRAGQKKRKRAQDVRRIRPTHSLTQIPHKNTKLEAIMYTQRTWFADSAGPVSSYELCSCWSRGLCFHGILHPFWLLLSFCLIFCQNLWAPRKRFDGDTPFSTECSKISDSVMSWHILNQ